MIPSYFKIEILAIQDEFVLSGRKGLNHNYASKKFFKLKFLSHNFKPLVNELHEHKY